MLRERIKSSAIIILIINLIFLTFTLWFTGSADFYGDNLTDYFHSLPVLQRFFPVEPSYSISKENLSRPRKFLVNDGSLWMAYYNTDIGFSPIEQRMSEIIRGFLQGDITASKQIDYATWQSGLDSRSIYVEYPVSFSMEMFCRIMGVNTINAPSEINALHDLIIIPSSEESDICILVRDSINSDLIYAYIMNNDYVLPSEDLSVYTNNDDGYYEPAFSTGLLLDSENKVSLSPFVLFSDSQPETAVLHTHTLINDDSKAPLLEGFSFNPLVITPYEDSDGALNYIANYASAKIYPDSIFEYTAIEDSKGIILDESADAYNVLNASIDFAEKIWLSLSSEPLNILVTSDLSDYSSESAYTFRFDYYCNGRPVKLDLPSQFGHEKMNCAIEMTVKEGRLISYRQYLKEYSTHSYYVLSDTFVTALDGFVNVLTEETNSPIVIEDIYIGYLDNGIDNEIYAAWLAKTSDAKVHRYFAQTEVTSNELD